MSYRLTALLFAIMLLSCNEKKVDINAAGEDLMQVSREWSKSAAFPDSIEKTMSYWADSAVFLSSGYPVLKGKKEIRGMVEQSIKQPGFNMSWEPMSVSISKSGDMGYMIEKNQVTMNDSSGKPITVYGQAVTIWKKDEKGAWKNVVDVSVPAPPQQ